MKFDRQTRIRIILIGTPITFVFLMFYYGFSPILSAAISAAGALLIMLSFVFEKKSVDRYEALREKISSGGQPTAEDDEVWREKYAEFCEKEGFRTVTAPSMKGDLIRRYIRPWCCFMAIFGIAVSAAGLIFMHGTDGGDIVVFLIGLGIAIYGCLGIYPKNVRKFAKESRDLPELNDHYMNGRLLTYKKSFGDEYINDGINISEGYVVIFTPKTISVIKRNDIIEVTNKLVMTKYYGNDIYTGSSFLSHVNIITSGSRMYTVRLNDLQAQLVCDTLCRQIPETNALGTAIRTYNV